MDEKKYLKWYQKTAYGSGDLACNLGYALVSSFVLIYLTNTVGLNSAIIGTLMMVSKLFDGITDILFGTILDRTKSKLGKARPWMLYAQIGVSASLFLLFSIPSMSQTMQYIYFFIIYTSLNAIFFTANGIAYSALSALITRNTNERVQLGSIRFMFALFTNILVSFITFGLVEKFGGGASGWRTVALIYAIASLAINTFSCLMVKELPEEKVDVELQEGGKGEKISLLQSAKYLFSNKYYLIILAIYLVQYGMGAITQGVGIYYMTYVLGDASLFGRFTMMSMFPMIISLSLTPVLVKKFKSMWRVNTIGFLIAIVVNIGFIFAALNKNVTLMLSLVFIKGLFTGPMMGTLNALIAEASAYTFRKDGVHIDGTMFSCSSLGIKVGGGIGSAIAGLLLAVGGFNGMVAVQSESAISMITFMYIFIPFICAIILAALLYMLNVEKANQDWDIEHKKGETI